VGRIVAALATSHTLGSPDGVEDASERVWQGMREVGARLRAARPDVPVLFTSDHLNNFTVDDAARFAVAVDETLVPYGDMGLPTDPIPGQPEFARGLAAFAKKQGLVLAERVGVRPDHGSIIPLGVADPARAIPTVIVYVNAVLSPSPTCLEGWRLGELVADYVAMRPDGERVAVLGAGGLSHWVGMPQEGKVNVAWDHAYLEALNRGEARSLADFSNADILARAGNGGLEVSAWMAAAGAAGGAPAETVYYEAIPDWATGMGGVQFRL
jgi:protocatechuate 4,5-dioxygenase beta chain/2'-aminobiphenyl-2,3-diol 1,2-dioxygenase large subunit